MTGWLAWVALVMGVVEGATEFVPVSSTGHLIVVGSLLGFSDDRAKVFDVFIQLGAILAVVWLYRDRFKTLVTKAGSDVASRRLIVNLAVAFLPAAVVGLLLHDFIKARLFSNLIVAGALVTGGFLMLIIERWRPKVTIPEMDDITIGTAFGIGLAQVLSLVPGTSRAAATIMGGFALGCSRTAATEFSFFLAVPVMFAATGYDLYKSRDLLSAGDVPLFALGFAVAFITALFVVKRFLHYVSHASFAGFAWYRIAVGALLFLLLSRGVL